MNLLDRGLEKESLNEDIRFLELADLNENFDEMELLIEKLRFSKNTEAKQYSEVYSIHRKLAKGELTVNEASKMIGRMDISVPELKVFSELMLLPEYLNLSEYKVMNGIANKIDLDTIENENFFKASYRCRLLIMSANAYLGLGDLKKAQFYAGLTIEHATDNRFLAYGYLIHGNTLLFSDYREAKKSFLKGLEHSEKGKSHYKELRRSLSFLENYYGEKNEYLDYNSLEVGEQQGVAYSFINEGKIAEALQILDRIENEKQNNNLLGFHFFYKGLATKSKDYFFKSVKHFKLSDDNYCVKLPLDELEKLGENKTLLELITL